MPTRRTIIANLAAAMALVAFSLAIPMSEELLHQLVLRLPVTVAAAPAAPAGVTEQLALR